MKQGSITGPCFFILHLHSSDIKIWKKHKLVHSFTNNDYLCRLDKYIRRHDDRQYHQVCVHPATVAGTVLAAAHKGGED